MLLPSWGCANASADRAGIVARSGVCYCDIVELAACIRIPSDADIVGGR